MLPDDTELEQLRAALAHLAPLAARIPASQGERLLDELLAEAGLDPTWPQWEAYLRAFVVERRMVAAPGGDERGPGD